MAPFDLSGLGSLEMGAIALSIGLALGFILERAGFGDSRKLASQFYLNDMTVIKVMFTGIIVAAALISLTSAFGLLDIDKLFINPTHLGPAVLGGLLLGMGFLIGGY